LRFVGKEATDFTDFFCLTAKEARIFAKNAEVFDARSKSLTT
jgi:hypothetical protein